MGQIITSEIRTLPSGRTFLRLRCECRAYWDVPGGANPVKWEPEKEWHKPGCSRKESK